jgi:hypothetical protein
VASHNYIGAQTVYPSDLVILAHKTLKTIFVAQRSTYKLEKGLRTFSTPYLCQNDASNAAKDRPLHDLWLLVSISRTGGRNPCARVSATSDM